MDFANTQLFLQLVVFSLLTLRGYSSSSSQRHSVEHVVLFVFGDSLFDPGNNNYINTTTDFQANFWPYGISYFDPPSGGFSDGRLIPDFIAEYAGLPIIPTYLDPRNNEFVYGANFASGGAGALVESHAGFNLGDSKTDKLLSNAVYLFSCGGNDYLSPVGNNDSVLYPYTHDQYERMVIGNISEVFKGIHEKGGRKIGITTVAPLACWPSVRAERPGNTCNEELDVITSLHNQRLSKKLVELEEELEGFMYALFDLNTEVSNRMKNPSKDGRSDRILFYLEFIKGVLDFNNPNYSSFAANSPNFRNNHCQSLLLTYWPLIDPDKRNPNAVSCQSPEKDS